jgi:superfamily II DNA or RNA helicase
LHSAAPTPERLRQQQQLEAGLRARVETWDHHALPLTPMARELLARHDDPSTFALRLAHATCELWSDRADGLDAVLAPLRAAGDNSAWPAQAQAVDAAALALDGRWAEARQGFDAAWTTLRPARGLTRPGLSEALLLPQMLALLAHDEPRAHDRALQLCRQVAGRRADDAGTPRATVAQAIDMVRGTCPPDPAAFAPLSTPRHAYRIDLWRWLMRAWLVSRTAPVAIGTGETEAAARLSRLLHELGLHAAAAQVESALQVVLGAVPAPGFFARPGAGGWRQALAGLAAIGQGEGNMAPVRLLWVLGQDAAGAVDRVVPHEQKRGVRGWGKARALPLSRLTRSEHLAPHDIAVMRALRIVSHAVGGRELDLAEALTALVGHPHVEFEDSPGVAVNLQEAQPELDVVDAGDSLVVRLAPLASLARTGLAVLRDGPGRARLFRLTPAQRRAAVLIGDQLVVPRTAVAELRSVLRSLSGYFQVHADGLQHLAEVTTVQADTLLRAELAPQGNGINLRLVAAPLGARGPRSTPGQGRAHLIATVGARTLGTERDLAGERAHLEAVIEACPSLAGASTLACVSAEWVVESPDEALALIERLPQLPEIAGLDWPRGQGIRVDTADVAQLYVQLRTEREWLAMQGRVQVDEKLVLNLEQLLRWQAGGGNRFVPLGEGRYLALTDALRARLADLAAVSDEDTQGRLHAPSVAAPWLQATLDGAHWEADQAFMRQIEQLNAAQFSVPLPPPTLQARLRPYQEEGYAWAMRLARAGLGAVLADDMGLGKTLQSLAVLLARAAGGAALVVAPTSLAGNWLAEAQRFAPSLRLRAFGEADDAARGEMLRQCGPGEVVLVSYQLLLQHAEAFSTRRWHTLIVDEAQAIKNAAARRSQAMFELDADFRMALSGTPVENRLAELWSLMRLCNPGLLGSQTRFQARFAAPIERDRNREAQRVLRRLIAPFVLRRTKAQVLDDLPPQVEQVVTVEAGAEERAHYEAVRRQALAAVEQVVASDKRAQAHLNILAQLTRLRRAACDPRLVSPQLGLTGAKVTAFAELAAELVANGHRALVFSQFVDFLALLRQPLQAAGFEHQYLDGSTPAAERTRRVDAFQAGQGHFFLISLKAGGQGLNLTAADYVVIADPWWNPAVEDQASARAWRIGQQRSVTVYRLVSRNTLEERVLELHRSKRELAEAVLGGVDVPQLLDPQELVDLMRAPFSVS